MGNNNSDIEQLANKCDHFSLQKIQSEIERFAGEKKLSEGDTKRIFQFYAAYVSLKLSLLRNCWQGQPDLMWPFLQCGLSDDDAFAVYCAFREKLCPLLDYFIEPTLGWAGAVAWSYLVPDVLASFTKDLFPTGPRDNGFDQSVCSQFHDYLQSLGLRYVASQDHLHWIDFLICFGPSVCVLLPAIVAFPSIEKPETPRTNYDWHRIYKKPSANAAVSRIKRAKYWISASVSTFTFLSTELKHRIAMACTQLEEMKHIIDSHAIANPVFPSSSSEKVSDRNWSPVASDFNMDSFNDDEPLDVVVPNRDAECKQISPAKTSIVLESSKDLDSASELHEQDDSFFEFD